MVIVIVGEVDPLDQEGAGRITGDDGGSGIAALEREIVLIQTETSLGLAFIGSVTRIAIVREDGLNLGGKVNAAKERMREAD